MPASGQQRGGEVAALHLVEPRLHVAAQRRDVQVGPGVQQLRLAPRPSSCRSARRRAGRRTGRRGRPRGSSGPRISASRASSRCSVQASTMPAGISVSRSFRLCTAKSIRRSAAPRGFPWRTGPCRRCRRAAARWPASRRRWCGWRVPGTRPCCAAPGRNRVSTLRKARVWTSASGEPRVPTRNGSSRACRFDRRWRRRRMRAWEDVRRRLSNGHGRVLEPGGEN